MKFVRFVSLLSVALAAISTAHAGSVARLLYDGISASGNSTAIRNGVQTLKNASIFPDGPTFRDQLDDFRPDALGAPVAGFQGKENSGVDFGSWVRGYLEAPETGNYVFYIASDDNSELWLSSDWTSNSLQRIAYESSAGAALFSGTRLAERRSAPIPLTRGSKYYFEVFHKQGGGSSYLQVGWERPNGVQEIIPARHLAQHPLDPYLGRNAASTAPFFNQDGFNGGSLPSDITVPEHGPLWLEVDVVATQPTTFTWYSNGVVIPGENLSFLYLPSVSGSADFSFIQVEVSNPFGAISATTILYVTPDATSPSLLGTDHRGNPNGVDVTFSEPVNPETATNLANYSLSISGGSALTISSATLSADERSVHLAGNFNFAVNSQYRLTIQNVTDQSVLPNTLSPNPTVATFTYSGTDIGPVGFSPNSPLADQTVVENRVAQFAVIPSGAPPFYYQWFREDVAIPNATNSVLEFLAGYDDTGRYHVVVSNAFSETTSPVVVLTVQADNDPPYVFSTRGLAGGLNEVRLTFDELLDESSATNLATYALGFLPVLSATLNSDGHSVTLITPALLRDQLYLLTIAGLKDRALAGNVLNRTVTFLTEVDYVGEVLADVPVRYWHFNEAASTTVASATSSKDALSAAIGTLTGSPTLGVAGLVPNLSSDSAIEFAASNSQYIAVPDGNDLNTSAGPWAKKSFEFWFRANSVPAPESTGLAATAGIWEQGGANRGAGIYLWRDPANPNPSEAALVFHAVNNLADGGGSPFGGPTNPAVFVQYTVRVGEVNHVVAVFDGDSVGTNGFLRLYVNGVQVAVGGGVGQLYNHTSDIQLGHGNMRIHTGANGSLGYFDGVIDEFALYNTALSASRVAAHYQAGVRNPFSTPGSLSVAHIDTRGNPNELLLTLNQPVAPETATHLANFVLKRAVGSIIPIQSAALLSGDRTIRLQGAFNFGVGFDYVLTVSDLLSREYPPSSLASGSTNVAFSFTAPATTSYTFNSGVPPGVQVFGAAGATGAGSHDGSGYLRLTDAAGGQSGAVVFHERRDIEQARIFFKARLSDASAIPGDGFSVNLAGDLPSGTFNSPEEGYVPAAAPYADRLVISFDNYSNHSNDPAPSISVKWRGIVVTNVLAATNGVPALHNADGHWADVDIRLRRGGKLSLVYDGVTILDQFPTGFESVPNGQVGLAARTGGSFETHWFDDISLNFAEDEIGPVGISSESELANATVVENQIVRFAVVPTGAGPFAYQWYYNGTPIAGATSRVLDVVATTNVTGSYYAVARNEFSQVTSRSAILAVDTDVTPPGIEQTVALAGALNEIRIFFNEPVDPVSATNLEHYSATGLSLINALISADGRLVTLKTSPLQFEHHYVVQVQGVKDRSASGNIFTGYASASATIRYADEVLADGPVRYWPFDETNGVTAVSVAVVLDTLVTGQGTYANAPGLGRSSLVPNTANGAAVQFVATNSQRVTVPNGADLNTTVGPWAKKTIEFWFNATSVPAPGTTGFASAAGLWEEGAGTRGLAVYLWRDPNNVNAAQAELLFHVWNNSSDGPGAPFGAPNFPAFVSTTVTAGVTYHVVAVFDGNTNVVEGQLVLYVNGVEVGRANNVGLLYNHTSDVQIARGNALLHNAANTTAGAFGYFDGFLDEFSVYNTALGAERVAAHYQAGITAVTPLAIQSYRVENNDLILTWQGSGRLERALSIRGPFTEVVGASSPYREPINTGLTGFFRLVR